jgi:hypothetical protein
MFVVGEARIPVPEEGSVVSNLAIRGWAVRGGEYYRIKSSPAIRITISALEPTESIQLAEDIACSLRPDRRTHSA